MIKRNIVESIYEAVADSPVILINGARQSGKSTLAKQLSKKDYRAQYHTLDDANVLDAAISDPEGFISSFTDPVIIDEIQRAPELFVAIKSSVDKNRQPGKFILTSSADIMLLPKLSDSLAGRMEIFTLWPFSQGELSGNIEAFIDTMFKKRVSFPSSKGSDQRDILRKVMRGGYPEIQDRRQAVRRNAWFDAYSTTIVQRDIRDISNIAGFSDLPRLLQLLSARSTYLLNYSEIARSIGIPLETLKRYVTLLQMTFLVQMLPAWSGNLGKQTVKSPKLYFNDTGLLAYLQGVDSARPLSNPNFKGPLIENFVIMEIRKQLSWSKLKPDMFHFRTTTGYEVDILLENRAGDLVGIEVKSSATIRSNDFKGLRKLSQLCGKKFKRGIVIYMGESYIPFGKNLYAIPVNSLWDTGSNKK